jgi:hypothetical protein
MSNTPSGDRLDVGSPTGSLVWGVTVFAGVLLTVTAVFQIVEGIAAIANDTVFVRGLDYTWQFDVTAWGWIHLVIGLVALATGVGILMGQTWGLLIGIFIAGLSALSNFMFMPYYPFWSLAVIGLDVLVIWALCKQVAADRV